MKKWKRILFLRIPLGVVAFSVVLGAVLKYVPIHWTPLMLKRSIEFRDDRKFRTRQAWVPLEKISGNMEKAVILSEDASFRSHMGFDFEEMRKMLKEHRKRGTRIRGCSTISQQTAKNVFTFCTDTWARKAVEAYWTVLIELIWGKDRIMEVYLNVVEMGRGIYGIEAASQFYYGHSCTRLSPAEAAAIACCLPRPLRRTPHWVMNKRTYKYRRVLREISNISEKLSD